MMEQAKSEKTQILKQALTEIKALKKQVASQEEKIAVIGMACRFPGGIDSPLAYWEALIERKDLIGEIPQNRWESLTEEERKNNPYLKKAGFLTEDIEAFDHRLFRLSAAEVEKMDPQQRLYLKTCWEALENTGYAPDSLKGTKTGVFAGVSAYDHLKKLFASQQQGTADPHDVMGNSLSFMSGRVSYFFGFQGPGISVDTACSSSLVAVDQACKSILAGDCSMALAGGVNLMLSPDSTKLMASLNVLSVDCQSKTFDATANGTVRGEGAGVVVLKKLSEAERDGDHIHAVILASSTNQDGLSSGLTAPYGPSQEQLLKSVWEKGKVDTNEIDFIETHGTGTELGDPIEINALNNQLAKNRKSPLYLGAVKSNMGHLEGAAGIAGLIKVILAVENGQIPANLHFNTPTPHIDWNNTNLVVPVETVRWEQGENKKRVGAVSAFGLSGTNAHALVGQYSAKPKENQYSTKTNKRKWPFKFSATTHNSLNLQLSEFATFLNGNKEQNMEDLSYSVNISKADLPQKKVVYATTKEELRENIDAAISGQLSSDILRNEVSKRVVFLFSGGGSQYPGMFKDFYSENKVFRQYLDQCNNYYRDETGEELLTILFTEDGKVNEMEYTQIALFAVQYALSKMWMTYGIRPEFLIGHSTGEYVAACIAGVFSLQDAVRLITHRGRLMYRLPKGGGMAAILTSQKRVEKALKEHSNVSIAAVNAPEQIVVSGDKDALELLCEVFEEEGVEVKRVDVTHAAHSALMQPMLNDFNQYAESTKYDLPKIPILSTVTGEKIGTEITTPAYWNQHIIQPVRFFDALQQIQHPEEYVFLEVGPSPKLISLVADSFEANVETLASNYKDESTTDQIQEVLFNLYLHGSKVNWRNYYSDKKYKRVSIPNYQFDGTSFYVNENMTLVLEQLSKAKIDTSELSQEEQLYFTQILEKIQGESNTALAGQSDLNEYSKSAHKAFDDQVEIVTYLKRYLEKEWRLQEDELKEKDNLLHLGLNSIAVARCIAVWKKEFGLNIKPDSLLKTPTIENWSSILWQATATSDQVRHEVPFVASAETQYEPFELNEIQKAYWAGRNTEIDWGGVSCSAYFEMDVDNLDVDRFAKALEQLVKRHAMLRCIIMPDGMQKIVPDIQLPLLCYPVKTGTEQEVHLLEVRDEMSTQILPLGNPMFEMRITPLEPDVKRIHFSIDFLIADALSLYLFWNDLYNLYNGVKLSPLSLTYKDYLSHTLQHKDKEAYTAAKNYWTNRLTNFPLAPQIPVSNNKDLTGSFNRREVWLDNTRWQKFAGNAANHNLTPSAALLTLYAEVLSGWGGGEAFAVMLTVFNRETIHEEINKIIGDFTTLTLVEIQRRQQAVGKNGLTIQEQLQNDLMHNAYPALDFVKDLNSESKEKDRLYPFVFTSALGVDGLSDTEFEEGFMKDLVWSVSSTPQVWIDHQIYNKDGGVMLSWDTFDAVFPEGVVDKVFTRYIELVNQAIEHEGFWTETITDVRTTEERKEHDVANSTTEDIDPTTLHEAFFENAAQLKDKVALVVGGSAYSYEVLADKAEKIAGSLNALNCGQGDLVAIHLPKSFDQIAAVLAVLKIGATYVPLTYNQPVSRTKTILETSSTQFFITDQKISLGEDIVQLTIAEAEKKNLNYPHVVCDSDLLAYIIYTSGSTGTPKGVSIKHSAAMNTILDVNERLSISEEDVALGVSALSFDLSVFDIFGLLSVGGTLVLPTEEERIDPKSWHSLCINHDVTVWNSVPALMDLYTDYLGKKEEGNHNEKIREIIHSGDWIPLGLFAKIKSKLPNARLTSMGGATEASIWSNYFYVDAIDPKWKSIPYGYPLSNQRFYIADEFGRPCPTWVEGKLYIAGKGLAENYYNETELTEKAFFESEIFQERVYDTGDYGRYTENGIIEFLGRKDAQLKINGYRIEIGEVKAAFRKCKVEDPIIVPIGDKDASKKLVGFIKQNPESFDEAELKVALKEFLPGYFIPERIFAMANYPTTANGKIDHKALVNFYLNCQDEKTETKPVSNSLSGSPVLDVISKITGIQEINGSHNFADLGISSVDMIRLANLLETKFGERPSVGDMIKYETVAELVAFYGELVPEQSVSMVENSEPTRFRILTPEEESHLLSLPVVEDYGTYMVFNEKISNNRTDLASEYKISFGELESNEQYPVYAKEWLEIPIKKPDFLALLAHASSTLTRSGSRYVAAGNKSGLQLYFTVFDGTVEEIEPGHYYLNPVDRDLVYCSSLDTDLEWVRNRDKNKPAFFMHVVSDLNVLYPLHGENALKFSFVESGLLAESIRTAASHRQMDGQLTDFDWENQTKKLHLSQGQLAVQTMTFGAVMLASVSPNGILDNDLSLADQQGLKQLTNECRKAQIDLYVKEGQLKFKAPKGAMTPEILGKLKANKAALIAFLLAANHERVPSRIKQKYEPFRLTQVQLAYLLGRATDFELGNVNTHYYIEFECAQLDPERLEKTINELIVNHEMLRTKVYADATQRLMHSVPHYSLPVNRIEHEDEIIAVREKWSHKFYETGTWPMFNISLSQLKNERSRVHFSLDCLLIDAASAEMLIHEMMGAYAGEKLLKPNFTFREYISKEHKWLNDKSNLKAANDYWDEQLYKLPPAPDLPLKTPFNEIEKPHFKRWKVVLSEANSKQLLRLIKAHKFTPSAVVCTVFMKVLALWSKNADFTINLTIFNRLPIHPDVPKVLGDFTNITLIGYFNSPGRTFQEEVQLVQEQLWKAVEYRTQDGLDMLRILGKDTPGKAIMPIVFTSLLFGESDEHTANDFQMEEIFAISQTPQVAMDHQVYQRNGQIHINWDIVDQVFEDAWLEDMIACYEQLLIQLVQVEDWSSPVEIFKPETTNERNDKE